MVHMVQLSRLKMQQFMYFAELDPAEDPVTIGGAEYKQFVQASTAANSDGAIPGNGTATYVFSPKVDCSVTLHSRATSKVWYFLESPDGANVTNTATDSTVADVMTFNLRAGRTYYYYCQGSKPMVYGIYFDAPVADADSLLKRSAQEKMILQSTCTVSRSKIS